MSTLKVRNISDVGNTQTYKYVVETGTTATGGWRLWSDGFFEEWGRITGYNASITITFSKTFADTNYSIQQGEIGRSGADPYVNGVFYSSLAVDSVVAVLRNDGTNTYMWRVCGYT